MKIACNISCLILFSSYFVHIGAQSILSSYCNCVIVHQIKCNWNTIFVLFNLVFVFFDVVCFIWLGGKSNLIECTRWNGVNKWCSLKICVFESHKSIHCTAKCTWSSLFFPSIKTISICKISRIHWWHTFILNPRLIHQQFNFK